MLFEKFLVDALTRIVPRRTGVIDTVDEYHRERAVRRNRTHVVRETAMEFVADERIVLFVKSGTQHELIEAMDAGQRKERIVQTTCAVVAAKVEPERILARRRQAWALIIAALHADAALDLEARIVLGLNPFDGCFALPRDAVLGGVMIISGAVGLPRAGVIVAAADTEDAGGAVQIVGRGDEGEYRERADVFGEVEEVSVRTGFGREVIGLERRDPEQRGVGDLQRTRKQSAAGVGSEPSVV